MKKSLLALALVSTFALTSTSVLADAQIQPIEGIIVPIEPIDVKPIEPIDDVNPIEPRRAGAVRKYISHNNGDFSNPKQPADGDLPPIDSGFTFGTQMEATLRDEMQRVDAQMDSVMASTHAINNARPYLSGTGKTAIGVGLGYASDESAIAIGVAHSFTDSVSASFTINATNGNSSSVSGGVGVQYQF